MKTFGAPAHTVGPHSSWARRWLVRWRRSTEHGESFVLEDAPPPPPPPLDADLWWAGLDAPTKTAVAALADGVKGMVDVTRSGP